MISEILNVAASWSLYRTNLPEQISSLEFMTLSTYDAQNDEENRLQLLKSAFEQSERAEGLTHLLTILARLHKALFYEFLLKEIDRQKKYLYLL
jgi:hypothetical protein